MTELLLVSHGLHLKMSFQHDHQEERNNEPNTRSSSKVQRPRPSPVNAPSLLFKRAFSDILGTPCRPRRSLDSETRRSQEGKQVEERSRSDPEESPLTRPIPKPTIFEKKVVGDRKPRNENVKRAPSPTLIVTSVIPERKADVLQELPRLVFLDEDSDKDVDTTVSP